MIVKAAVDAAVMPRRQGLATVPDACTFLSVSRAHLYKLMNVGALRHLKLGKKCRRIRWADLQSLVDCE